MTTIDRNRIARVLQRLRAIEQAMADPAHSQNPKELRKLAREHAALRELEHASQRFFRLHEELASCQTLQAESDDEAMQTMAAAEIEALSGRLASVESEIRQALVPTDPDDARNAVVEIRAGTGGTEAALFAADLYRMYSRYVENRGWRINRMDAAVSDLGGFKEIVFMVVGPSAYGTLRFESGGHRVQRIPATETQGRIHTSAATVAVFPEAEPEDDIDLPADSLRIDIFCASGPGGQGVNTTYSAVRITHLPSGLVAQSQDERSQHRNREKALAVLKARVLDHRRRTETEQRGLARRTLTGSGDRSQRIRTYSFPQNRLTDHRINLTLYSLDRLIEGELAPLLRALRDHDLAQRETEELEGVGQ